MFASSAILHQVFGNYLAITKELLVACGKRLTGMWDTAIQFEPLILLMGARIGRQADDLERPLSQYPCPFLELSRDMRYLYSHGIRFSAIIAKRKTHERSMHLVPVDIFYSAMR